MTRKEMIDYIIANSFRYTEQNRKLLKHLNDGDLQAVTKLTTKEVAEKIDDMRQELSVSLS
ncbi:hypothetical protein [Lentilactobacillus rapi]|uniref:Uncharacterized protein n=3 Tax=Lactobacillaceae TaxID=33958 RepID=A0A512PLB7_9LACO|nr:hypothetical protein [Lentilactobacillus rapi]GEP71987.1 hypothetical protein LRA02_08550 [Lentilactobacillus rapi]